MNILILNDKLEQVSLLSTFISLQWIRQFNSLGEFEICANLNTKNAGELKVGRIVYLDDERVGIIENTEITRSENTGGEEITANGIELKDIICRRITIPPVGFARDEYINATTEEIVRSLLEKNIISPMDPARKIDICALGTINNVGGQKNISTRYIRLSKEIYPLLQSDSLGFVTKIDLDAKIIYFEVVEGLDRTINQTVNPTAIFSLEHGTLKNSSISNDCRQLINFAYVGDSGDGTDRTIITCPENGFSSGIDRREAFIDARSTSTNDEMILAGDVYLSSSGQKYSIEGDVRSTVTLDYSVGDFVTVKEYKTDVYQNQQITTMIDKYVGSIPMKRTIILGRPPMDFSDALKSKLSEMDNILTQ